MTKTPPRILCLDIATRTGYATLLDGVPNCGSFTASRYKGCQSKPAEHEKIQFVKFANWINAFIPDVNPDVIVLERPGFFRSPDAGMIPYGFRAFVFANAAFRNISLVSYSPSTVKKHLTGHGKADKSQMILAARKRFPSLVIDKDDEADALGLLSHHLALKYGIEYLALK